MEPLKLRDRPERRIQDALVKYLEERGWFVKQTHGNAHQDGFPDLYATHLAYGQRWIEVKNAEAYHFTPAQIDSFTKWSGCGVKIWVLVAATDEEYKKLFAPANWQEYLSVNKIIQRPRKPK